MSAVVMEIEVPSELSEFRIPDGVQQRLQDLLDRQDQGETLTLAETKEAEGLVDLSELLSLLRLRARRVSGPADQL